MNVQQEIFLAVAYCGTNVSAVARAIGMNRQTLHRKINTNNLTKEELCKIGKALGGKSMSCFYFPGGIVLGDKIRKKSSRKGANAQNRVHGQEPRLYRPPKNS